MSLSDRIRERINAVGLTQKSLADKVGISQVAVHKLLSGESRSTVKIIALAKALQCSPDWLENGGIDPGETLAASARDWVPIITWAQVGSQADKAARPTLTLCPSPMATTPMPCAYRATPWPPPMATASLMAR